jgi:hypothetical protein
MMSEEQQRFFKPLIVARWHGMKWLSRDPELRKNKERQIRIEDDIFHIKQQLAARDPDDAQAKQLIAELRKVVEELVDARMAERELRIERLEMLIAEERELLKHDQFRRQSLVDKRMQDLLAAEVPVIDPPQRPPGAPGERRGGPEKRGGGGDDDDDQPKR